MRSICNSVNECKYKGKCKHKNLHNAGYYSCKGFCMVFKKDIECIRVKGKVKHESSK